MYNGLTFKDLSEKNINQILLHLKHFYGIMYYTECAVWTQSKNGPKN